MYYHCIVESLYYLMRVAVIITSSQREPFWALLSFTGPTGLVLRGSSMLQWRSYQDCCSQARRHCPLLKETGEGISNQL